MPRFFIAARIPLDTVDCGGIERPEFEGTEGASHESE